MLHNWKKYTKKCTSGKFACKKEHGMERAQMLTMLIFSETIIFPKVFSLCKYILKSLLGNFQKYSNSYNSTETIKCHLLRSQKNLVGIFGIMLCRQDPQMTCHPDSCCHVGRMLKNFFLRDIAILNKNYL